MKVRNNVLLKNIIELHRDYSKKGVFFQASEFPWMERKLLSRGDRKNEFGEKKKEFGERKNEFGERKNEFGEREGREIGSGRNFMNI